MRTHFLSGAKWALFVFFVGSTAFAGAEVNMGAATTGGNGCLNGNARFDFDAETGVVKASFPTHIAQLQAGQTAARSACSIAIPVSVAPGFRLAITKPTLNARGLLPKGSSADLRFDTFVAGIPGLQQSASYKARWSTKQVVASLKKNDVIRTACGADALVRMNTSAVVQRTRAAAQPVVRTQNASVQILVEPCR